MRVVVGACTYAIALALTVGVASAQDPRLAARLDVETAAAVTALVDSAQSLALPTEPLVQTALEGRSKGAPRGAIIAAVRSLIRDLATARDALGRAAGDDALRLAASALDAGVTAPQLARLRPYRSRDGFAGGLAGLVYLVSGGVTADQSVDLIADMLKAQLTEAEFGSLRRLVERDVSAGAPPAQAAAVRARALIRHARTPGPGGDVPW